MKKIICIPILLLCLETLISSAFKHQRISFSTTAVTKVSESIDNARLFRESSTLHGAMDGENAPSDQTINRMTGQGGELGYEQQNYRSIRARRLVEEARRLREEAREIEEKIMDKPLRTMFEAPDREMKV